MNPNNKQNCHQLGSDYAKLLELELDVVENQEWQTHREPIEKLLADGQAIGPVVHAQCTPIFSKAKQPKIIRLQWELKIEHDQQNQTKLPINAGVCLVSPEITTTGTGTRKIRAKGALKTLATDHVILTTDPTQSIEPGQYLIENTQEYARRLKACLKKANKAYPVFPNSTPRTPNWAIRGVDQDQAIAEALAAESMFVIQGPPGTGKTYVLAKIALAELKRHKRVYVVGFSNQAVENALLEIRHVSEQSVTVYKKGDRREIDADPPLPETDDGQLASHEPICIGATFHSLVTADHLTIADVILIDEAGQVPIYCAALLPQFGKKLVFFGDHKQLAPVSPLPQPENIPTSALTHILACMQAQQIDQAVGLIKTQRLCQPICAAVRDHFYGGGITGLNLQPTERNRSSKVTGTAYPGELVLIPHSHQGSGQFNEPEALIIQNIILDLLLLGQVSIDQKPPRPVKPEDIVVLAPYRWQTKTLQKKLGLGLTRGVTIGTVDKMQGQSVPICIYSMTAGHPIDIAHQAEFLFDAHRFNVAISRSKAQCLIVGNLQSHCDAQPKTARGLVAQHQIVPLLRQAAQGHYQSPPALATLP